MKEREGSFVQPRTHAALPPPHTCTTNPTMTSEDQSYVVPSQQAISLPTLSTVSSDMRNDYKHSNNCKTVRLMVLLRLYSWRNSFPPKNTVTFLRPDDANVRLLSFNIPRNSPEFPSLKEFPYFCPLSEGSSEKEFGS